MPNNYGHDVHGVNVKNLKALETTARKQPGGLRSPTDWTKEVSETLKLAGKNQHTSAQVRDQGEKLVDDVTKTIRAGQEIVSAALTSKIQKTETLKALLERSLHETELELESLVRNRSKMIRLLNKNAKKMDLNDQRQLVRAERPPREQTNDAVQQTLSSQGGVLEGFQITLERGISNADVELKRLKRLREQLQADLRDKVTSLSIDQQLQQVGELVAPSGPGGIPGRRGGHHPHAWQGNTERLVKETKAQILDSVKLRSALQQHILDRKAVAKQCQQALNERMTQKIHQTREMKSALQTQLREVQAEMERARTRKAQLQAALSARAGPLNRALARFDLRGSKPSREQVQDEVEHALMAELNELQGCMGKLQAKVAAVDKEIRNLEATHQLIDANIKDKSQAQILEEACAMLDGRSVATHAPSEASTNFTSASSTRSMTLARIRQLEMELEIARKERQDMEATLVNLAGKGSLGNSVKALIQGDTDMTEVT